jgi:hypothetical protein
MHPPLYAYAYAFNVCKNDYRIGCVHKLEFVEDLQGSRKIETGLPYLGCHLENSTAVYRDAVNMVDIPCLLPYVSYVFGLVCFAS